MQKYSPAPHLRRNDSSRSVMIDAIIPLLMLLIVPLMYSGVRVLIMAGTAVLASVFFEGLFCLFARKPISLTDLSAIITGLIISMLLPVTAPLWLPAATSAFAVLIAKCPFGGLGRNPFNPAASGIAFAVVCFGNEVFKYRDTKIIGSLNLLKTTDFSGVPSPAAMLMNGERPDIFPTEMILGNYPGPMGTTTIIVIIACALYLMLRRTVPWQIPVCFITTAAIIAFSFPRIPVSRGDSVLFEMLSGSLVFAAVFMATDPATSPKTKTGRVLYGVLGGILCMTLRRYGPYEQSACFAILIINSLSPFFDKFAFISGRLLSGGAKS